MVAGPWFLAGVTECHNQQIDDIEAWQNARELTRGVYAVSGSGQFAGDFSLRDQIRGLPYRS
jgi:hypothetical protein